MIVEILILNCVRLTYPLNYGFNPRTRLSSTIDISSTRLDNYTQVVLNELT